MKKKMQFVEQREELVMHSSGKKHVLGIVGSPRRGANTETLIDTILAGAAECKAFTEKVILSSLDIEPCCACDHCKRNSNCIHDDDMKQVLDLMEKSDVWVLGTPIYWWGPSTQMKTFIDRWYGLDQRIFQEKQVILAISMGGGNDYYARHTIGMFREICDYLGMSYVDQIVATGMNGRNSIHENIEYIKRAREVGINAVKNSYE